MKNCTPLWHKAHFQVKMCKTHRVRTIFWSWNIEKIHAVAEKTMGTDHFRRFRCCLAWQAQVIVHLARNEKNPTVLQQLQLPSTTTTTTGHDTILQLPLPLRLQCRYNYRTLHCTPLQYTKLHHTTLHYYCNDKYKYNWTVQLPATTTTSLYSLDAALIALHYALRCNAVRYTWLHYTTPTTAKATSTATAAIPLHYATLITSHQTTLHYTPIHFATTTPIPTTTTLTAQYYTTLHYATLPYPTLHHITSHHITSRYVTLRYITLHYSTVHYITLTTPPQIQLQLH